MISRYKFRVNSVENNNLVAICPSKDNGSVELFFIRKGILEEQKNLYCLLGQNNGLLQTISLDIDRVFFNSSQPKREPLNKLEVDEMNIIARWLYRHRNDQSLIYIRKKRSKTETIAYSAEKVKKAIQLLVPV
jgi:hypothetical protein